MIKVLIIDDEIHAIEAVRMMLDWESYGIAVPEYAVGPAEARKKLLQPFDIVICDIRMPGTTGLQLMEEYKDMAPEQYWIFLSAYSEFEYVQEALRLGAKDYLLKPVPRKKLMDAVEKAVRYLEEQQDYVLYLNSERKQHQSAINALWQDMMAFEERPDQETAEEVFRKYDLLYDPERRYVPVVFIIHHDSADLSLMLFLNIRFRLEQEVFRREGQAVIFTQGEKLIGIFHSFRYEEFSQDVLKEICDKFCDRIKAEYNLDVKYVLGNVSLAEDVASEIVRAGKQAETLTFTYDEQEPGPGDYDTIAQIRKVIEENYDKPLSRDFIAKEVHMSADYIGKLFSARTGMFISEYVNNRRLEKAKVFLRETDMPIGTIAMNTGFSSFSYFSQLFKEDAGMSPNAYRKKYRI